ncbi:MAG: hypothetical protein IPN31_05860 [Bacteroidetes bacterium]|nr:hypothetical protein [Bacteroidota bacterium]
MKSILVISRSFYPDNSPRAFRTTELVKEFSRQGHNVILLTTKLSPSQQKYVDDINIEIKSMGVISWPTINIVGRGLFLYIKRALRRILQLSISYPELQYMFMINKALKKYKGF